MHHEAGFAKSAVLPELKMYAWMEIMLVYIIIISLKGNPYHFRGGLSVRIIFLKDFFMGSVRVVFANF